MRDDAKVAMLSIGGFWFLIALWTANNMLTRSACYDAGGVWRVGTGCVELGAPRE